MKIGRTIKILWNEIQHIQFNLRNEIYRIENVEKLKKIYLRRAQEKTSLHYYG